MPANATLSLKTSAGPAKLALRQTGRRWEVLSFHIEGRPELSLAFSLKGGGTAEDLDGKSDMAQCFGLSNRVRVGDVVLGTQEMRAASLPELEAALKAVRVVGFNHEEI